MNRKLELLKKLKRAHDVYITCTNEQKNRLFDACEPIIVELEKIGMAKIVSESLLMFGSEFYWKEHLDAAGDQETNEVFGK